MFDNIFDADSRAVSEVMGSILVFGLVIALISMVQVQAVPNANADIEFGHSNQVTNDMANLRVASSEAVTSGQSHEATVKLGVGYPARLLFYNPPPANGRLSTTERANITVENVASSSRAGKLFENVPVYRVGTRALTYDIEYNEYGSDPVRTMEPTVYYERFDNETLVKDSSFVDGREVTLVAVGGNYSESGVNAEAVTAKPVSGPTSEYTVSNNASGPITITVPTKLPLAKWNETLADEYASTGASVNGSGTVAGDGYITELEYTPESGEFNELSVTLKQGEQYTFRTGKVGFGTGGDPGPRYMSSAVTDGSSTAGVVVRDAFNNPVSGVTVWANTSSGTLTNGSTNAQHVRVTTGPDGVATVRRISSGATTVTFSEDLNESGRVEPALEETTSTFGGAGAPILLSNAEKNGADTVDLSVQNGGPTRTVTRVQTHYITKVNSQTVANSANLITVVGSTVLSSLNTVSNSNVTDGPDAVESVNGVGLSSPAVEGKSASLVAGSPAPQVSAGSTQTLTLTLDQSYTLDPGEALLLEVTVFYDDGHRERYTVHLFANEA